MDRYGYIYNNSWNAKRKENTMPADDEWLDLDYEKFIK